MKRIMIIGGKLQGVEAAYLAKKAGIKTILVDKNPLTPAMALCDEFICENVVLDPTLVAIMKDVDFVLPAFENVETLDFLWELHLTHGFNLAFDKHAYSISSSKILSNALFKELNIPQPTDYENSSPPFIAKPSNASGSHGVIFLKDYDQLHKFMAETDTVTTPYIIEKYLPGKQYSIEIIGTPGDYKAYEVTELFMDDVYDCKGVSSPCSLSHDLVTKFQNIGIKIAEALNLVGIMDVEAIEQGGELWVLEIDARLPSQTPTAVYHSTGVNMISEIGHRFFPDTYVSEIYAQKKHTHYEHFLVEDGGVFAHGEHLMSAPSQLELLYGFCGADECLTDYEKGRQSFRGTFINTSDTKQGLDEKREAMLKNIHQMIKP